MPKIIDYAPLSPRCRAIAGSIGVKAA